MKVLTVVGARPQFVKAAMVSRALSKAGHVEFLVNTGQHYDENMCKVFFDELGIPKPDVDLEVGSGTHACQTGQTMMRLEPLCVEQSPDVIIVYGDTNATVAGALVGAKLCLPVAHVEAGLRSFDRAMPEEINRIVADSLSTYLFCPTELAVRNLAAEGLTQGVTNVGDVMFDAARHFGVLAEKKSNVLDRLEFSEKDFVLVTIHRDFNTDSREHLTGIVEGILQSGETVVFPAHPRVRKQLKSFGLESAVCDSPGIRLVAPLGYLDMIRLERAAKLILTDSGGVQKEAFFYKVPCVTVRPSTEWVETVESGWNRLVVPEKQAIAEAIEGCRPGVPWEVNPYGDGHASEKMVHLLGSN